MSNNYKKASIALSIFTMATVSLSGGNVLASGFNNKSGTTNITDIGYGSSIGVDSRARFTGGGNAINPWIAEAGYWYADEDIRGILKNRLGGSVHISPALPFESKELVRDIVTHSINEAKLGKPALIPVNLNNNHWVALIIRVDEAGKLKVLFNDSLGSALSAKSNAALLVETIKNLEPTASIIDLQVRQQSDGSSCGAFTTENLITLAELDISNMSDAQIKAVLAKIIDSSAIRLSHLLSLVDSGTKQINQYKAEVLASELPITTDNLSSNLQNLSFVVNDRLQGFTRLDEFLGVASGDELDPEYGLWIQGTGGRLNQKNVAASSSNKTTNSKTKVQSFIIGADTQIDEASSLGAAISYNSLDSKFKASGIGKGSTENITSYLGTIYGSTNFDEHINLFSSLSYGKAFIKDKRELVALVKTASKTKGDLLGSSITASYNHFLSDNLLLTSRLGASYNYINLKGFNIGTIKVSKRASRQVALIPGIQFSSIIDMNNLSIIPEVHSDFSYPVLHKGSAIFLTNSASGQNILSTKSKGTRSSYRLGTSITLANNRFEVGGGYDYLCYGKSKGHLGYGKIRINF